ncbi:aldehyde dehydrogenase family protein [Streptomyces sp. NPDC006012]|uniref:aldehyde dehydrogenase family protein n=1 Tax=Streptomyces sp. NPDC006012 TaxID=3364739 RepID=UPI0036847D64
MCPWATARTSGPFSPPPVGYRLMPAALKERFAAITVGDPKDEATLVGPMSSERALDVLLRQIEATKAAGARIVHGGNRVDRPGFFLEPTIVTDIDADNPLYQEEAFVPVLSFYVVDSEEEAIQLANATRFGLGGYVFDADVEHARQVATRIEAGMVYCGCPPRNGSSAGARR